MKTSSELWVVGAASIGWIALLVKPQLAFALALAAFLALVLLVLWSSLRHRRWGWASGTILGLLLVTLPAWVLGAAAFYEVLSRHYPRFFPIE